MILNFSLKRAWVDLFSSPKYVFQFLAVLVICTILNLIGDINPIKGPQFLSSIIILGYLALFSHNIIQSKEGVLDNIFNNRETNKFLLLVGLKGALLETIYAPVILIPSFYLLLLFFLAHLSIGIIMPLSTIILSPLFFYLIVFPSLLFSEKLKFIDGFNLKRAFKALKLAWKDYILCFLILHGIYLLIFTMGFVIFNLFVLSQTKGLSTHSILSYCSHITWSSFSNKLPQNSLFDSVANIISAYFATHIVAQVYRNTLIEQENNQENNQENLDNKGDEYGN